LTPQTGLATNLNADLNGLTGRQVSDNLGQAAEREPVSVKPY